MATGILGQLIADLRLRTRDQTGDIIGTATSTSASKLRDSNATFVSDGVAVGDTFYNTTDTTSTTVTAVDSEISLSLADDIFISGESYRKIGLATSEQLWTDSEFISFLVAGEDEVCMRAFAIEDGSGTDSQITLSTDTAAYAFSSKTLDVMDIYFAYDDKVMNSKDHKKTKDWLNENMAGWQNLDSGTPLYYIVEDAYLTLVPAPDSNYNTTAITLRHYRKSLTALSTSSTTPSVDAKYYEAMKVWALHRAYLKPDSQTLNVELAKYYENLMDSLVGPRPSLNIQRIMKEEPQGMQISIRRS